MSDTIQQSIAKFNEQFPILIKAYEKGLISYESLIYRLGFEAQKECEELIEEQIPLSRWELMDL